jgi:hypothetical protein
MSAGVDLLRATHPMPGLLDAHNLYENRQIELILNKNKDNDRVIGQLEDINTLLTYIKNYRSDPAGYGDYIKEHRQEINELIERVNLISSDLVPEGSLENMLHYSDDQWNAVEDGLVRREKILLTTFNPNLTEIEQLFSDLNKVHEIVAEIIKAYHEGVRAFIRNQIPR